MKHGCARFVALLCVVASVIVAAVELWPATRSVRTADQNGDGRPDIWRHYDNRGQLVEVDVDSNFDGQPDIEEYYERSILVRRESDRNFNGQTDLVEEFDVATRQETRSVVDTDYDGTADLLVLFQDGRPVFSKQARSQKRPGIPNLNTPGVRQDARHLAQVNDPFESDTAIRSRHVPSTDEGCVGLSTAGGLPCPRVSLSQMSPSARFVAREVRLHALLLPTLHPSRAPPVS